MSLPEASTGSDHDFPTVKNLAYVLPIGDGVTGAAINLDEKTPKIFTPLKIGNLTIPNRIGVSPMAQYASNESGLSTEYHKIHYGSFATRGPGLIVVESSAVTKGSGCSLYDLGMWNDQQAFKFKEIVEFVHAQAGTIGIQLNHGGRKANGVPYFISFEKFDEKVDKSSIVAPSPIMYRPNGRIPTPRELTIPEIKQIVKDFGQAAKRAIEIAKFDFIEIHAAHGYLLSEFLSKITNQRTDEYGGSLENRSRIIHEVIDEMRSQIPKGTPIFIRIHSSDIHDSDPNAWTIEELAKFAASIAEKVELIDVSAGGNDPNADRDNGENDFGVFVPFAKKIRDAIGKKTILSTVAKLNDPIKTNQLIEDGIIDVAFIGTKFLNNPGLTYEWADKLNVKTYNIPAHFVRNPPIQEMVDYVMSTFKQ